MNDAFPVAAGLVVSPVQRNPRRALLAYTMGKDAIYRVVVHPDGAIDVTDNAGQHVPEATIHRIRFNERQLIGSHGISWFINGPGVADISVNGAAHFGVPVVGTD